MPHALLMLILCQTFMGLKYLIIDSAWSRQLSFKDVIKTYTIVWFYGLRQAVASANR